MNKAFASILAAGGTVLLATGCSSTHDKGPYLPQVSKTPAYESREPVVLMDPGVQYSVTCSGINEQTLPDGRLEVVAHLRNRENRRVQVQVNCEFKDAQGFVVDATPFQNVFLDENAQQDVQFTAANDRPQRYTIRVREAR